MISVDLHVLSKEADNINNQVFNFDSYLTKCSTLVDNMGNIWQGGDYNQFKDKMTEFFEDLKTTKSVIEDYSLFVSNYAKASSELNSSYSSNTIDLK